MIRFVVAVVLAVAACVPAPSDPLDFGELCLPDRSDCPSDVVLQREVTGRNQIDWALTNTGDSLATVEILALVPTAQADPDINVPIAPDDLIARRAYPPLESGERLEDRFTAQDLGVRESFAFAIRCNGCSAELEWVFGTVPRECFADDDCIAGWQCDDNIGRCAECLANADCNEDQSCNVETGRCDPPETTAGCSTAPGASPGSALLLFGALLLARRRSRRGRIATLSLLALLLCAPATVSASPPRASISLGTGPRFISGALGAQTQRGVGLAIGQELRWRYVGAGISLGTSYFLTRQQPPPFSRQFQTYSMSVGPRIYLPIRWFELVGGLDYRRLGVTNNSLVRITGTRTSFDAVGGGAGFRVRWSGIELRLEGGAHQLIQLPSAFYSIDLLLGFTNPT